MCEECVKRGLMTQEELDAEHARGKEYIHQILELLKDEKEEITINVLLSCLINSTVEFDVAPGEVIMALTRGMGMTYLGMMEIGKQKDTKH